MKLAMLNMATDPSSLESELIPVNIEHVVMIAPVKGTIGFKALMMNGGLQLLVRNDDHFEKAFGAQLDAIKPKPKSDLIL